MSLTLKQKICSGVACALGATIVGFGVASGVTMYNAFKPAVIEQEDMSKYELVFSGKINLLDTDYDIVLKGKDQKFSVDANTIHGVMDGTYTYTEGQGWTFTFDDAAGTIVRSMYDKTSGAFSFIYSLDMGSRGAGNIRLSYEKKDFNAAAECWADIPSFAGTAVFFGIQAPVTALCDADGNFKIFGTGTVVTLDEIVGTYEYKNDSYIFTAEDGTVYTTEKDENGLHTFTYKAHTPQLDAYGPYVSNCNTVLTQVVLTVD